MLLSFAKVMDVRPPTDVTYPFYMRNSILEAKDKKELSAIVRTLKAVSAKEINGTPRFRVGNNNVGFYRRKPVEGRSSFWARRYAWNEPKK